MSCSLDYHIREQLARYLAGEISLREFEDWFFPETWDVDQIDNLDLLNLVYGIKLRLAEFSHRDWTEAELQEHLRPFIQRYVMVASPCQIQYGTSSAIWKADVQAFTHSVIQSADIEFSVVYG